MVHVHGLFLFIRDYQVDTTSPTESKRAVSAPAVEASAPDSEVTPAMIDAGVRMLWD